MGPGETERASEGKAWVLYGERAFSSGGGGEGWEGEGGSTAMAHREIADGGCKWMRGLFPLGVKYLFVMQGS